MANRAWKKEFNTLTPGIVTLHGVVKLGSTGAISSQTSKGFTVTRTSAGLYLVTLQDNYIELLKSLVTLRTATTVPAAATSGTVFHRNKAGNLVDGGAKTFTFQAVRADTQVAAEVEDNAELEIEIVLRNSSVTY